MTVLSTPHPAAAAGPADDTLIAQGFVDLICADQEWVDDEFAAIVAACGDVPPPSSMVVLAGTGRGPSSAAVLVMAPAAAMGTEAVPAARHNGRQRSPPGTG
jgi:hypothetical protein